MSQSVLRVATLPLLVSAAACTSGALPGGGNQLTALGADYVVPVRNMVERRFLTVVRQQYDFSCGSAALATLLNYHYGDRQTEASIFTGMWRDGDRAQIRRVGFSLLDMKRYLAARGIGSDGYRVTLEQIAKADTPGIALIDTQGYKHFVVVKGLEGGMVLVGDPALGIREVSATEFRKQWNGILFAINGPVKGREGAFGREEDWALVTRARTTLGMEPVSLQALALTRPLPGEV